MRYSELIQFDPIETVVQIKEADDLSAAERLVSTYVISDHMAERLVDVVIPNLQFKRPADQKGLLVIGNYGTGKSHLMAVISAVAEHADLLRLIRHDRVREAAEDIAGQFKVLRLEIGATTMPLRDIITGRLTSALAQWEIDFRFPSMAEAPNTKDALQRMMAAFNERFPDKGLLVVVDEMLDYLRSRDEQEIILDLAFMREVGEICRQSRLRFIGGLQEQLFDSPRFQFVASEINRVKDRYQQVQIAREDVAFVVSERLLRKDAGQRAWIRSYLEKFASLYPSMAERLDSYVTLFPVHPAYIEVFESIHLIEKREVLRTLSHAMKGLLDEEVPEDRPGLVSYDSYWDVLVSNPALRSDPNVRQVIDKGQVLESKVRSSYTRPAYLPMALRIIHALGVYRLTTLDLKAPLGLTPAELRDGLCLYLPNLPEQDPEFLLSTIETAIKEVSRTVSGQYLGYNQSNGQWYLDITKDVDYDALIQQKAETLSPDQLDRYFYNILRQMLELTNVEEYVSGFRIWAYQLEWPEKRVMRPGYIFFGAPNQRSTAHPPREFYIYFLPPYDPPAYEDKRLPDEVFFRLGHRDEEFEHNLRLYAGALEMASTASSDTRGIYRDKAESTNPQRPGYASRVIDWIQRHAATNLEVIYQGEAQPASNLLSGRAGSTKEMVDAVASRLLSSHFHDLMPEYPTFSVRITRDNLPNSAMEAVRRLAIGANTQLGNAVLGALELLDGDRVSVRGSRYARYVLEQLEKVGPGRVLNRADLIESQYMGAVEYDRRFHLEPELFAVVLVALVYAGEITLAVPGYQLDAGNIDQAARIPIETLKDFQHVQRPRDIPLAALTELFEQLGLQSGLLKDPNTRPQAVTELAAAVEREIKRVVDWQRRLREGLTCWNARIIEGAELSELESVLRGYQGFLERLRQINTVGKLRSFPFSQQQVEEQRSAREALEMLEALDGLLRQLQPLSSYLLQAQNVLPLEHPLQGRINELSSSQLAVLRDRRQRATAQARQLVSEAQDLKKEYIQEYVRLHNKARLDLGQDQRKQRLIKSDEFQQLRALGSLNTLQRAQLRDLERALAEIKVCGRLSEQQLENRPVCPDCDFRPSQEARSAPAAATLEKLEGDLHALYQNWVDTLLQNLEDPAIQQVLRQMSPAEREPIEEFRRTRELPRKVDDAFVQALNTAFEGIEVVPISLDYLFNRLTKGGLPTRPDEMRERLDVMLRELLRGRDQRRVRILVEREERSDRGS